MSQKKSEPARTCYSAVPLYGGGQSIEVGLQDWLRLDSLFQYRGISMRVLQQTPDGELSTKVYWDSKGIAGVTVTLQAQCLEKLHSLSTITSMLDPLKMLRLHSRQRRRGATLMIYKNARRTRIKA